jgi:type I restriction enzyme M protein
MPDSTAARRIRFGPYSLTTPKRAENDRAWHVSAADILANGCNLDRQNPRSKADITHLPPAQIAADILKKEQRIAEIVANINSLLEQPTA